MNTEKEAIGDINLTEAYENYLKFVKENNVKSKGIMDFIREDSMLSRKITFEEAVLMNPSIVDNMPDRDEILKRVREKYKFQIDREIDDGLEEAFEVYLQTKGMLWKSPEEVSDNLIENVSVKTLKK